MRWCNIRILFTHPYYWPYVRRGAEREIHDLGRALVARGHDVTLLTTKPHGVTHRATSDGINVRYIRGLNFPGRIERRGLDTVSAFALPALAGSLIATADLIHSWHYPDAAAVVRRGRPLVFKITGSVTPEWMERFPLHRNLVRKAIGRSTEVWCNSEWVRGQMRGYGREMQVIPAGLDREAFKPSADRSQRPTVFSAGAPDEPRKRLVDVFDAWGAVRRAHPDAVLRVAGSMSRSTRAELFKRIPREAAASVVTLGVLGGSALAEEYSRAWVSVAAAPYEALGLTTLESLACGTPVVGANDGATTALLTDPAAGRLYRLFDPAALAEAITQQLDSIDRVERAECRRLTESFDWSVVADTVERAYRRLV